MSGTEAAAIFYDPTRFQRTGAAPEPLRATLFGKGAVQTLDGAAHRRRKALFIQTLSPTAVANLANEVRNAWEEAVASWREGENMPLYKTAQVVYTKAVCRWAGVPLPEKQLAQRTALLVSLFDDAARNPVSHLRSRLARLRAERWLKQVIVQVRSGRLAAPEESAVVGAAMHRDVDGRLLEPRIAAVELLNVLRPTVAASVYFVFAAHAVQFNPELRLRLQHNDPAFTEDFLTEVRRFYPFFPALVAKVRKDFEWNGFQFKQGRRAILDLYGTNRDPSQWSDPDRFDPDRHVAARNPGFSFIPQGGGEAATGHRCPGEGVVMAVVAVSLEILLSRLHCKAVPADPALDCSRLPALPRANFLVSRAN